MIRTVPTSRLLAGSIALTVVAAACGGGGDDRTTGDSIGAECAVDEVDGDLALYNWAEYIDPDDLDRFADEFGIRATMDVFDSNEAMQPIVAAGNSGFDVIVPSDYMVGIMIASGNISKLNKDALPNLANLSAEFTGLDFDPTGDYSVPYQSGTTGLAVDTSVVGTDFDRSWSLVFDPGDRRSSSAARSRCSTTLARHSAQRSSTWATR